MKKEIPTDPLSIIASSSDFDGTDPLSLMARGDDSKPSFGRKKDVSHSVFDATSVFSIFLVCIQYCEYPFHCFTCYVLDYSVW